jgi:hypothetical protein
MAHTTSGKAVRELVEAVRAAGADVVCSRRSAHYKVYLDGRLIGSISSTTNSWNTHKNEWSMLRRNGLELPPWSRRSA